MGLIEVYTDGLNLPHTWGNAKDLLTDADLNSFDVIYNTPTNYPLCGDIFVCGASWGQGAGHTGLIVNADVNSWTGFEQNNPVGHAPQVITHSNYNGVLGWMRPKIFEVPTTPIPPPVEQPVVQPTPEPQVSSTDTQVNVPVTTSSGETNVPITIPSTQPVSSATPSEIPVNPAPVVQPAPLPTPVKPKMTIGNRIIYFFMSIKNTLLKWMQ